MHLNLNNFWRTKALRRIIKATERWMRSPYWISLTKICYNPTTVQFLYCLLIILAPAYLGGRRKANRSPYWSPNWISLTKICYNLLHPATTMQFLNSLKRQDFKNIWSERFRMEENHQKKNYRPCDHHCAVVHCSFCSEWSSMCSLCVPMQRASLQIFLASSPSHNNGVLVHPSGEKSSNTTDIFLNLTMHNVQFVKYDVTVSFMAQVLDTVTYLVPQVLDTASSSNCLVRLYRLAI